MANDDFFQFDFGGLEVQVNELVKKLDRMDSDVAVGARDAAKEAAEIIASEQKRLLSQAHFKNGKADLAAPIKNKKKTEAVNGVIRADGSGMATQKGQTGTGNSRKTCLVRVQSA